mmetsp:Transcript_29481/g.41096  ORF Transcript_29481/g.41096 Transcript_29481/m.41096 type:complete len:285 (-) Transcript_29481:430-1284(-)|eukprot:CAMPEP_0185265614 /NCGR_PEP_ID=MMETSP1359-20130426/28182_1 /TAXON_ID=552665 /ORGANISM="Bigelowiella longifila, Strain CCMP242" /LENGTH=284 /DNA_ID=CAMNT_0027854995 /DNA_START=41 /DNA_END=895 /DNA_ORIENTATION=-
MSEGQGRDDDGKAQTGIQRGSEAMAVVTWRSFTFDEHGDEKVEGRTIRLRIREEMCADYGLYVWPSSIFLAAYLYTIREHIVGRSILEIGAGTGLPGILCAKLGAAKVSLTDTAANSKVLENLRINCRENKVDDFCKVQELCWGEFSLETLALAPDLLLGADVFYDSEAFEDVLATLRYFFDRGKASLSRGGIERSSSRRKARRLHEEIRDSMSSSTIRFISVFQKRSNTIALSQLLSRWGMKMEAIPFEPDAKFKIPERNSLELVVIKPIQSSSHSSSCGKAV